MSNFNIEKYETRKKTIPSLVLNNFNLGNKYKVITNVPGFVLYFYVHPYAFFEQDSTTQKNQMRNGCVVCVGVFDNNPQQVLYGCSVCSGKDNFSGFKGCMLALQNMQNYIEFETLRGLKESRKFLGEIVGRSLKEKLK